MFQMETVLHLVWGAVTKKPPHPGRFRLLLREPRVRTRADDTAAVATRRRAPARDSYANDDHGHSLRSRRARDGVPPRARRPLGVPRPAGRPPRRVFGDAADPLDPRGRARPRRDPRPRCRGARPRRCPRHLRRHLRARRRGCRPADPAATVDREIAAAALFATFAFAFFAGAEPSVAADAGAALDHDATAQLWQVAGGEVPFWANMVKYARFSISIMVGFAFMFGRPVVEPPQETADGGARLRGRVRGYKFFRFTIETMLGMNDDMTLNY